MLRSCSRFARQILYDVTSFYNTFAHGLSGILLVYITLWVESPFIHVLPLFIVFHHVSSYSKGEGFKQRKWTSNMDQYQWFFMIFQRFLRERGLNKENGQATWISTTTLRRDQKTKIPLGGVQRSIRSSGCGKPDDKPQKLLLE